MIIFRCVCIPLLFFSLVDANSPAASTSVRDYKLELYDGRAKTYDAVKSDCESRGAWLVEIKDQEIDIAVERIVSSKIIWIGLRYDEQWHWNDGSDVRYNNWLDEIIPTVQDAGNNHCVRRGESNFWSNHDCSTGYWYVCQSDTTYPGSFNLTIMDDTKVNFHTAKTACEDKGMRLIDIKTTALNSLIIESLSGKTGNYWTGGSNIGHTGIYKWGDDTIISNNDPGWYNTGGTEPNNINQDNHCVAIFLSYSAWFDVPCSGSSYYLCQKDIISGVCDKSLCSNRGSCEVSGTRYKCTCEMGYFGTKCEKDFCLLQLCQNGATCSENAAAPYYSCNCKKSYSGINCEDRIFLISGSCKYHVNLDERKTFAEAIQTCHQINGSLVMIKYLSLQDELEQQLITQYGPNGGNVELWVGGYRENDKWFWMDGTTIPRSGSNQKWAQAKKKYMIISSYGSTRDNMRWYSKDNGRRGFICEVEVNAPCKSTNSGSHGTCVATGCQANWDCEPGFSGNVCQNDLIIVGTEQQNYTTVQGQNVTVLLNITSQDGPVEMEILNSSTVYENVLGPINITIGPFFEQTEGDVFTLRVTPESAKGSYYKYTKLTIRVEGKPSVSVSLTGLALPVGYANTSVLCKAKGVPKPSATWEKDGMAVNISSFSAVYQNRMGDYSRLYFSKHARSEVGSYICFVQNTVGGEVMRANASLFVRGKPLILNKTDYVLDPSTGVASFVCTYEGYPMISIKWKWNNGTHDKEIPENMPGSIFQVRTMEKSSALIQIKSTLFIKVPEYLGHTVVSCCSTNGFEISCESFTRLSNVFWPGRNVTYHIHTNGEKKNYSEALVFCKSNNLDLVKIPNAKTQEDLSADLTLLGFRESVFTSAQRFMVHNNSIWKWGDGSFLYNESRRDTPVNGIYTAWSIGEPNEHDNRCLSLNGTKGWNWTDTNCNKVLGFICESIVSGIPAQFLVNVEECSSNISIIWEPGVGAIGVEHSLEITSHSPKHSSAEEKHFQIPTSEAQIWRPTHLKLDETYNVTIKVCPHCPHPYGITKHVTTHAIIPAFNVTVDEANITRQDEWCVISWLTTSRGIIAYKIVGYSTLSRVASSSYSMMNFTSMHTVPEKENEYAHKMASNRVYNFTIQVKTCTGFGPLVEAKGYCITGVAAPISLSTPTVKAEGKSDGTMTFNLMIPDETNGPISCIFIVVTYKPNAKKNDSMKYDLDQLQKASERAASGILNPTDSYLALSVKRSDIGEVSEMEGILTRILGDETITNCYIGTAVNKTRMKRSASSRRMAGTNRKLENGASYSIFIVTTTPGDDRIFYQTSSRHLFEFKNISPKMSAGDVAGIIIGVILLVSLVLATLYYLRKRADVRSQFSTSLSMQEVQNNEDTLYANLEMENRQPRSETDITLSKLQETYKILQENSCMKFHEQFQKLKAEAKKLQFTTEAASKPEMKRKNRYKNILPFDISRVILSGSTEESYINACYIDGFRSPRKFIATQGPLKDTVNDFWKMVLEQKSTVIVMLTRCVEKSKVKCEKYWPSVGTVKAFGDIKVKNSDEKVHRGYVVRTIEVSNATLVQVVHVKQFHFLDWPDHGVPITTTNIMNFCDDVAKLKTDRPIVVHCSAGAGRTGTFIGYNILSEEQKSLRTIDVYKCVLKMREQRVDMVQTNDQYVLLHKLLLEKHLFGKTEISVDDVSAALSSQNTLCKEFDNLSVVGPINQGKFGDLPKYQPFNRSADIVPYESNRVTIVMRNYESEAPYINASTLESCASNTKLIAAQGPTKATVTNFWRAVYDNDVNTVVMLTKCIENKKEQSVCYWPKEEGESLPMDDITIYLHNQNMVGNLTTREFRAIRDGEEKTIRHYQYLAWNSQEKPEIISDVLELVDSMHECVQMDRGGTALIHCSDGVGRTGVFCALVNLLARVKTEGKIDVFRTVKDLRDCRPGMVQTLEQYKLCYEAMQFYLSSFHLYSNFNMQEEREKSENIYENL